jgi:hypothetical protein
MDLCPLFSSSFTDTASVVINFSLLAVTISGIACTAWEYRKQKRFHLYSEYTKRYQEIIRDFPENVNEPEFDLYEKKGTEPGDARFEKTMRAMRMYFDLCFEEWSRHRRNEIDADIWSTWKSGMETAFGKPAFQQAWKRITRPHDTNYGHDFTKFVRVIMTRKDKP